MASTPMNPHTRRPAELVMLLQCSRLNFLALAIMAPLKARSFSDAMIANAGRFNLEHCNNITNSAGRRVWGFMGVEAVARPHINGFYDVSSCTYVPEEWRD